MSSFKYGKVSLQLPKLTSKSCWRLSAPLPPPSLTQRRGRPARPPSPAPYLAVKSLLEAANNHGAPSRGAGCAWMVGAGVCVPGTARAAPRPGAQGLGLCDATVLRMRGFRSACTGIHSRNDRAPALRKLTKGSFKTLLQQRPLPGRQVQTRLLPTEC